MSSSEAAIAGDSAERSERSEAAIAGDSAERPERSEAAIACELCEAARFTHWYYEDDTCWIADCEVCAVPMVVWRPHGTNPSEDEVEHMVAFLTKAGGERFGEAPFEIDTDMRTIPDHWHAHARDHDWFRQRATRPMSRFTTVGGARSER